ncbi:succinylglutamate desuccinylase/aspartoacylase family protein [Algoriphagus sp.]|uniref:succinylglutamate desuccinylase/aspartoacylase family protein n=1 Tax=Algoriphagus sp. TaxID=1872435 RepID=UPI0025BF6E8D|nr:succinylglutamate desuccinylase/aspartoacylase family protein [Algoriphagus sp.]
MPNQNNQLPPSEEIITDRFIDQLEGDLPGPHLVFFGGIHGNEPSGVFAFKNVIQKIRDKKIPLKGKITGIAGNLWALQRKERFQKKDLNRLWTRENIEALNQGHFVPSNEDEEQFVELHDLILKIIANETGPLYFFDLHTTSSQSIPFIPVNDSLINRNFANQFPIPLILGIEEYIDGPVLSYINELGYVSFGFEAGQHEDPLSVKNHEIFIQLSLAFAGACSQEDMEVTQHLEFWDRKYGPYEHFYEINFRFHVDQKIPFQMMPGYESFQAVKKGEKLAIYDNKEIFATKDTMVFMPLYQSKGEDGFFLIRKTPEIFLKISSFLRKNKLDKIITWLPGVRWTSEEKDSMIVDLRVARLLAKPILHLFGYRFVQRDQTHLIIWNRERKSKYRDYENEAWFKG